MKVIVKHLQLKMRIVALTGGISCGKSTVGNYLREKYGITIVDSDKISYDLQKPGTRVFKEIVSTFGPEIVKNDGTLNRKRLGEIVFNDRSERSKLNRIVHPRVFRQLILDVIKAWIKRESVIVLDIPLFFEVHLPQKYFNDIVTVALSPDEQVKRLMLRNQMTEEAARSRVNAQMPIEKKCAMSTIVLRNDGSEEDLRKQIDEMVLKWRKPIIVTWLPDPLLVLFLVTSLIVFIISRFK